MSERPFASPYAPPRAGRAAGLWRVWFAVRRWLGACGWIVPARLARITVPWLDLAVFCVPLLGFRLAAPPVLRRLAPALFGLAAFFALACIGQVAGGIALGLLASLHTLGIGGYLQATQAPVSLRRRLTRQATLVAVFTVLALTLVTPATGWLVIPMGTKDGLVLFNPRDREPPFATDALIAFRLPYVTQHGFALLPGRYLGRIVAHSGDTVQFGPGSVSVNGAPPRPSLRFMPAKGALVVPPGHTLVWPVDLHSWRRVIEWSELLPENFLVADSALVGRPYKRWFWRTFTP